MHSEEQPDMRETAWAGEHMRQSAAEMRQTG